MKVSELEGSDLDYWVARALGYSSVHALERESNLCQVWGDGWSMEDWSPSTNWHQGGPIIERGRATFSIQYGKSSHNSLYLASIGEMPRYCMEGTTHLVAAMRAFVASKFGEEVEDAQPQSAG